MAKLKQGKPDSETTLIKMILNRCMDNGMNDKTDIYSMVCEETGSPRPTVRRVARDLRNDMTEKIRILQSELPSKKA